MSQQYLFHEAGCIPGIAGTFANCRVDIDDDGTLHQSPLAVPIVDTPVEEGAHADAAQEDAPTNVAPEPAPSPEPEPEPEPESPSEPTSPPAFFNGG